MRGLRIGMLAAVIMFFFFSANTQAYMIRVKVDALTENSTNTAQRKMCIQVEVYDSTNASPPSIVQTIRVTAPDGSVLNIHPTKDWLHPANVYWKEFYASDFAGNAIPTGYYSVTVTPYSGTAITEKDYAAATFLPIATITSPVNGATGVAATPTFTWTSVSGVANYRLRLWDLTVNEPVYWWFTNQFITDFNRATMPPGALKPNRRYQLQIEARGGSQDIDSRSKSSWVTFTTGSW